MPTSTANAMPVHHEQYVPLIQSLTGLVGVRMAGGRAAGARTMCATGTGTPEGVPYAFGR